MDFRACSDEIPTCSFETATRLLWRNTNNELLPVYERQLCECCLQPQILRCECLGDNKWFLNQKPLIVAQAFTTPITQIWVKPSGIPQIWVNPQIWAITQNWGNHAQITQNWVLHLFLRMVIYLVTVRIYDANRLYANCIRQWFHGKGDDLAFNSLWPSDAIWRHRSWSTLAQIMACSLMAPSHYLNQCWLFISGVPRHSYENNFTMRGQATIPYNEFDEIILSKLLTQGPMS